MRITRLSCCIHLPCPGCPSSRRGAGPRCTWDDGSLRDCRSVKPGGERNRDWRGDVGAEAKRYTEYLESKLALRTRSALVRDFRFVSRVMSASFGGVRSRGEEGIYPSTFFYAHRAFLVVLRRPRRGARASHERARRDRVGVWRSKRMSSRARACLPDV